MHGLWSNRLPDAIAAARAATSRMIDLLVDRWGFSEVHAYLLCSVAHASAAEPSGERTDVYGECGDSQACSCRREDSLNLLSRPCESTTLKLSPNSQASIPATKLLWSLTMPRR